MSTLTELITKDGAKTWPEHFAALFVLQQQLVAAELAYTATVQRHAQELREAAAALQYQRAKVRAAEAQYGADAALVGWPWMRWHSARASFGPGGDV